MPTAMDIAMPTPAPPSPPTPACQVINTVAQVIAPEEAVLWTLETALSQLYQVVEELRTIGTGTEQISQDVSRLLHVDWRSPAGDAFMVRASQLRERADQLARTAEALVVSSRLAIDELLQRIQNVRQNIAALKAATVSVLTGGMC